MHLAARIYSDALVKNTVLPRHLSWIKGDMDGVQRMGKEGVVGK